MSELSAWCVTYLMHSTLLIVVVAAAARFIRSASVRDTLWKIALVGGVVTATLQQTVPLERMLPERVPQRMMVTVEETQWSGGGQAAEGTGETDRGRRAEARRSTGDVRTIAVGGYALVALVLIARILVGRRRFLAVVGARKELVVGAERALLDRLAERAGIARPVRLTESDSVGSPVAMLGWEIVIPAGVFARLSEEQQETILAHELGHLLRRDPLWLTVAEGVKALLFFQPLNWLVPAKLKETAEFLCDDAAVLQTGNQRALAETLAELAAHVTPATPAVAAMAEGGSNLIVRVTRVLRARPRVPVRLSVRVAMALVVLLAMALFAPAFDIVRAATRAATGAVTSTVKPMVIAAMEQGAVNYFADGELSKSFVGPDGKTRVRFLAHEAKIPDDGSYVQFMTIDGFVRVTLRGENGVKREVEITPDVDRSPRYRYRVNGEEHPWCDDARRAMISAFHGAAAYDGAAKSTSTSTSTSSSPKKHTWNGNIHLTGSRDGVPTEVEIRIVNIRYDDHGTIEISRDSSIDVMERIGDVRRSYDLRYGQVHWRGSWDGETREEWLWRLLREHTSARRAVVDSILRY